MNENDNVRQWDSRSKNFNIVINMPLDYNLVQFDNDIVKLCDALSNSGYLYFCAKHDKDIDKNGVLKKVHYHLVLVSNTRKRCSTICYMLGDALNMFVSNGLYSFYPLECIHVQTISNLALSVQYLIHKNDAAKYQYCYEDILTNSKDTLSSLFASDIASLKVDEHLLFHLVDMGLSNLEIMFKIGLGNYSMYSKVIKELQSVRAVKYEWDKLRLLYGDTQNDI